MEFDFNAIYQQASSLAVEWAPKVAGAILTLIIGFWLANKLGRAVSNAFTKRDADPTIQHFLSDLVAITIKILILLSAGGLMGLEMTSFIAIISAMTLAIGLALQGSLANFAGGVLILMFRPFRVGDVIEAQGYAGEVKAINIFVTTLETLDTQTIIIPNGPLSNGVINNLTQQGTRRVDLSVGISYDADIRAARTILLDMMNEDPLVLESPAPSVVVVELGDSSVNLSVRPHCKAEDYWTVYGNILEKAKYALDGAGVEIPFPQQVVHHINQPV
ncbi:mechanosensitive ion channel domain-containing protein [Pontibacter sp. G13]|uniref:mechanosensitive ion channel family protein n=1 Tax=Pontibacter sp. G13 TaxID=3074898 RepID=UPI00288922FB|nr:mechanosensitive ion channel domain-containing protein [Pontibacter sp. G13]WNJ20841.1 mechanosensitive ion channel [Pontibacter sp. G13]